MIFFNSTFLLSENVPKKDCYMPCTAFHNLAGHSFTILLELCRMWQFMQILEKALIGLATNTCYLFITELTLQDSVHEMALG